ncbi:hypothetical protein GLOTRDRAFT_136666 [Gloeophyllum trabeum ATCC 11539]|uniref:Uncharacterized protein n=1 Tax=Gloeophyllum trabeum (strain ATCC 11539 / FP-39264 / Madison 617) TaxID=670483 RepID=S7QD71_GLOTA|nr:uncharacterized protein GLOTRDRAFT_136666 [Gloeophyllum trabeum ATCC 11539]EPQ57801.1 hypothetical protein GLOTRDRAFT_136666 [Gloeophyllum trabeum ATCC 11539]
MSAIELQINDDHPLALELASLRAAISRYQHEAHASSVKLQRHSLETAHALERAHILERENATLREELATLRAHPDAAPHPAALHANELTLSLRRLSDKLTATEEMLLERTAELADAQAEAARARHDAEAAYELAATGRARQEEGKARERELERRVRAAEEERRMTDLVVQEYADLVRALEGRKSSVTSPRAQRRVASDDGGGSVASSSSVTLVESLSEGKSGLHKLLSEFYAENERLEAEVQRLHGQLSLAEAKLKAEHKGGADDRAALARARAELDRLKADDNAAAKVVSRYMKFSQATTDNLQTALSNLKARHAATLSSMDLELQTLRKCLLDEKRQTSRLRAALDELSEDISRETYGRRREVALRLALLSREESIVEGLKRWSRRTQELLARTALADPGQVEGAFDKILRSAAALLDSVDGSPQLEEVTPASVARILAAQDAVNTMVRELQVETERRLKAERKAAKAVADESRVGLESAGLAVQEVRDRGVSPPPPPPPPKHEEEAEKLVDAPRSVQVTVDSPTTPKLLSLPTVADGPVQPQPDDTDTSVPPAVVEVSQSIPATPATLASVMDQEPSEATPDLVPSSSSVSDQSSTLVQTPPPPSMEDTSTLPESSNLLGLKEPDVVPQEVSSVLLPAPADSVVFPSSEESNDIPKALDITVNPAISAPEPSPVSSPVAEEPFLEKVQFPTQVAVPTPPPSSPPADQSALTELLRVKDRYDDLQRAFRECHQALRELKATLSSTATSPSPSLPVLRTALERLDDYNEDTRVELEIRVADEERVVRGYETLLTVPGAIAGEGEREAVEKDVREFVEGSGQTARRDREQFARKLEDLQHDIAVLKRAAHELELISTPPETSASPTGWANWTSGLLGQARSSSPAPTFGSVMTSPRLRHTSSYTHLQAEDPFAGLGLRIPMPSHLPSYLGNVNTAPPRMGLGQPPTTRVRTTSGLTGLYALGLGSRSSSVVLPPVNQRPGQHQRGGSTGRFGGESAAESEAETETEGSDSDSNGQTDVE